MNFIFSVWLYCKFFCTVSWKRFRKHELLPGSDKYINGRQLMLLVTLSLNSSCRIIPFYL